MTQHTSPKLMFNAFQESYKTETASIRLHRYLGNPHLLDQLGDVKGMSILDVGCGFGRHLKLLENQGAADLIGLDISRVQISIAKGDIHDPNIKLFVTDICRTPKCFGELKFDVIYSVNCLNSMQNKRRLNRYWKSLYYLLKTGGEVVIFQGNEKSLSETALSNIQLIDGNWRDGAKFKATINGKLEIFGYYWSFDIIKEVMMKSGFKDIQKIKLYLKEEALKGYTSDEWEKLTMYDCHYIIKARK